jgi:putative phage-type endonuclease
VPDLAVEPFPEFLGFGQAEQRTEDWLKERIGKITASRFEALLTQPKTKAAREAGELSRTAIGYMNGLLAEVVTGLPQEIPGNKAMEWGTLHEGDARIIYEDRKGVTVEQVGFQTHPDIGECGCSPDGLVDPDGLIEIKCPFNSRVHLEYVLGGELPKEYVPQVQGQLWITGRKWCDFVSYDPRVTKLRDSLRLALWIHRVKRDEEYISELAAAVYRFRDAFLDKLCKLRLGRFQ